MRPRIVLAALVLLVSVAGASIAPPSRAVWPYPVFEDNLAVEWSQLRVTEQDRVTLVIRTIPEITFIKGATVYLSITDPDNVTQGPFPNTMVLGGLSSQATFGVRAYPNGTT